LFYSSSPSGKSKGKHESRDYIRNVESDVKTFGYISEKLFGTKIGSFKDLGKVEAIVKGRLGANSLISLELATLKALAAEKGRSLWQMINPKAKKLPFPVGNCIGGGLHSSLSKGKKPEFQEFLIIPKAEKFSDNVFLMKKAYEFCERELEVRKVKKGRDDENAWSTTLDNEEVLVKMKKVKEELENLSGKRIETGVDIAASTFYTGFIYNYKNKKLKKEQQINYVLDLIDEYNLDYVEDPLQEEDFSGFAELKKQVVRARPSCIIVGDDLTVSQLVRFKKAIKEKSINAVILKPNQVGSLLEISEIVKLAKRYGIKTVMSHRSGETLDYALADLAFAFSCDYLKTGIIGKEREVKLRRMIEIEKNL